MSDAAAGAEAPRPRWTARAWSETEPVVAAILGVWVLTFVVATLRMHASPVTASDFEQYCLAVDGVRRWDFASWPPQRSAAAALLPGLLARGHGTVPGLVHATLVSMVALLAAIFTWARHVGGRRAGWLAVACAPCVGPLVVLGRTVTFYPEVAAMQVLAAAALAGAWARGTARWNTAAALAIAALPLVDVRGVLLALAYLPAAMVAGWFCATSPGAEGDPPSATPPPRRARIRGALLPLAAMGGAWVVGRWAQPSPEGTLQRAVAAHVRDAAAAVGLTWPIPDPEAGAGFAWGHGSVRALIDALAYVRAVEATRPAGLRAFALDGAAAYEVWTLRGLVAAGLAAALIAGIRRPRTLAALLLPGLPLALLLWNAMTTLPHVRQLATSAAVIPVVLGVGGAALLRGLDAVGPAWLARPAVRSGVLAALLVGLTGLWTGTFPSRLAPDAWWREIVLGDDEPRASLARATRGPAAARNHCDAVLARDAALPGGLDVPWFPAARPAPRYLPHRLR